MSVTNDKAVESTNNRTGLLEVSVVGPYKLILTIGNGQFTEVKLAEHIDTGEEVAIKIIDKTRFTAEELQNLYREARIMKRLNHPNIVKILDVIDTPKKLYLVMEYVCGGDVFEYLGESDGFSEDDTRTMFRQIVSAVEYCHRRGIIHRDLKTENILLDNEMNLKITGFGLSEEYTPGQKLNTFCGTPEYSAPEVLLGRGYGPGADVWSLGVVLYHLVTGVLPFDEPDVSALKRKVMCCNFKIPPSLSVDCLNLLEDIFIFDPDWRPNLNTIMKDKWLNYGYENVLKPYVGLERNKRIQSSFD